MSLNMYIFPFNHDNRVKWIPDIYKVVHSYSLQNRVKQMRAVALALLATLSINVVLIL